MKRIFYFFLLVFFLSGATGTVYASGIAEAAEKQNEKTDLSYAFGMMIAMDLTDIGLEFNYDSFTKGFRDVMEDQPTRFSPDEAMNRIGVAMDAIQSELGERNRAEGEAFLSQNGRRPGVITTPSGLQYELITEGDGDRPVIADTVLVHYIGATIDGNIFDTTHDDGMPMEIPLDMVIPGWSEGLRMMREGEKALLYLPPSLAYGEWGAGPMIGPNSVIVFEVELIAIIRYPELDLEE